MKVFVSVDIEGVCGATGWDEARKESPTWREFAKQMTAEASAACEGALAGGATEVVVKDSHGDGRNIVAADLPRGVSLIRAYNGHPFSMVQGLDDSFAAALFVGFHSRGGSGGNPLAHTLSSRKVHEVRLDGEAVSEYRLHALAAASVGVPVALVTGDEALCAEVSSYSPATSTFAVKRCVGASTESIHPADAVAGIRAAAEAAVIGREAFVPDVPGACRLEVVYKDQSMAYARSWYPGATLTDPHTVRLDVSPYFEVLRALIFLVGL